MTNGVDRDTVVLISFHTVSCQTIIETQKELFLAGRNRVLVQILFTLSLAGTEMRIWDLVDTVQDD